ncbi:MAG: formylglycine-generating enzyme family protein [Planctomyces sp.]|nr:formylglycine-generating enzyme family protein [Planctomyces sp.]
MLPNKTVNFLMWIVIGLIGEAAASEVLAQSNENSAPQSLTIELGNGQSISVIRITAGRFQCGSPESEPERKSDELQHQVELTRDFYMGTFPVTVGQFRQFVSETRYKTEAEVGTSGGFGVENGQLVQKPEYNWKTPGYVVTDQHPVTIVTVKDALNFLMWLRTKSGRECSLPTESQWEYACRAGTTTAYYHGDDEPGLDGIGWHQGNSGNTVHPVGEKSPNAWGFFDLSGNVYEWCSDIYNDYPADLAEDPNPQQAKSGEPARNVLRGGSWMRLPDRCRSAARYRATPGTRNAENGFRVVMSVAAVQSQSEQPEIERTTPETNSLPSVVLPAASNSETTAPTLTDTHQNQHAAGSGNSTSSRSGTGMSWLLWSWLCFGGFVAAVVVALIIMTQLAGRKVDVSGDSVQLAGIRHLHEVSEDQKSPSAEPVRLAEDGFWLNGFQPGANLLCSYWVMNQMYQITTQIENSEQHFVYTGHRPESVDIVSIDDAEEETSISDWVPEDTDLGTGQGSASTTTVNPDSTTWSERSDSTGSSSSFPPAY